jgi:hypothetical protein
MLSRAFLLGSQLNTGTSALHVSNVSVDLSVLSLPLVVRLQAWVYFMSTCEREDSSVLHFATLLNELSFL